ncbi:hypothetical protein C0992_009209, partial [Termitomyces sp. T32_za158]
TDAYGCPVPNPNYPMGTPQPQYPPLPVKPHLQPWYWGDEHAGPLYGSSISQRPQINWCQGAPYNSHYSQVLPGGLPETPPQNWHPLPAASARPFALGAYYADPTPAPPTWHDPFRHLRPLAWNPVSSTTDLRGHPRGHPWDPRPE